MMASRGSSRINRWRWLLAVVIAVSGCVTPTLPPDDPPAPDVVELGVGVARLSGSVHTGPGFVLVLNRQSGLLFGEQTPDGNYDFEVRTEPCDVLSLWYTMGTFQSSPVSFRPAEIVEGRDACSSSAPTPVDAGDLP